MRRLFLLVGIATVILSAGCLASIGGSETRTPDDERSDDEMTERAITYVENESIDPTAGLASNTTVSGTTENITFTHVSAAEEIPYNETTGSDPTTLNETIEPASVNTSDDGLATVTLYTWNEVNGIVTRWNVTLAADGSIQRSTATAVAVGVGHYRPIPEGPTLLPEPGQVYINETV
jgi:hypothetical protein